MALQYCTTDQIKAYMKTISKSHFKLSTDELWNNYLTELGEQVENMVEEYCMRDFISHDCTGASATIFSVGRYDKKNIQLKNPILTLNAVYTRDSLSDSWEELDSDNYIYDADTGLLKRVKDDTSYAYYRAHYYANEPWCESKWNNGYSNVKVDYTWGYSSTPSAVNKAVLELIRQMALAHLRDTNTAVTNVRKLNVDLGSTQKYEEYLDKYLKEYKSEYMVVV